MSDLTQWQEQELGRALCPDGPCEECLGRVRADLAPLVGEWLRAERKLAIRLAYDMGFGGGQAEVLSRPGIQRSPNLCDAGVGGGEVCSRRKGHDGAHDPNSTEVYR